MKEKDQQNDINFKELDDASLFQVVGGMGLDTSGPGTIQISPDNNPSPVDDKSKDQDDRGEVDFQNVTIDLEKLKIKGFPGGKTLMG